MMSTAEKTSAIASEPSTEIRSPAEVFAPPQVSISH
jgi:hypothetical protein